MAEVDLSESNGGALATTAIAFLVLSWFSVVLRCYVRAFMTKGFQIDDWFMVAAQYQALATATYVLDMLFIKLSIGFFLLRLSNSKFYNWIIYVSLAIVTVWSVVIFFWNVFQCSPVEAQWDYAILNSKCVSPDAVVAAAYSISVMTILSDWLYTVLTDFEALLPIPMIWSVKMTKQAKATVIVILGLGIFASIATLIRLKFLADLSDLTDILFTGTDAMVWTLVEPGVAIVASSLVTIRPLLRAWRLSGFTSTDRTPGMSGAISGGVRSGTTRTAPRPVPRNDPYGVDDVDTDLELGGMGKHEPIPQPNSRIGYSSPFAQAGSEETRGQLNANFMAPPNRRRGSISKSEMYVIEGDKASNIWRGDRIGSPSASSVDLDGLDAQSQHSGRVGLGGRRDR
ncbi:integral membrane family protein [Colletotrichum incanum]|nr:integral membrane family protein [Colletotrichum incanum]